MVKEGQYRSSKGGKREPVIFVALLALILLIPIALLIVFKAPLPLAILALVLIITAALIAPRWYEFKEYERGVVFTFGKFDRVVGPGWVVLFPLFQSFERVDIRTQVLDIEPQEVITKEDLKIKIDAVAYIRVVDPKKAVIEIRDLNNAVAQVLHGELRTQIGKLPLQEVLEKTEEINDHLHKQLQEVEAGWGIKAINVEITHIELPSGLEEAFRKKQEAHEYKEKVQTEAAARKEVLKIIDEAAREMDHKTLAYLYLDALKKIADGKSNKILFPLELSELARRLSKEIAQNERGKSPERIIQGLLGKYTENQDKHLADSA